MRKNLFVRSIAAVSGIVMLASLAACGDNTSSAGNNSGSTSTEKITGQLLRRWCHLPAGGRGSLDLRLHGGELRRERHLQPDRFRRGRHHLPERRHRVGRLRQGPLR